ncbi:MAG: 4Fe-4S binding protein [Thaumarchaeota archaeon]|nr:4Fe-4S binding protein [Nitrososphaerota archaeon]
MVHEVDYKTKAIDPAFLQKPEEFPVTGDHTAHKVRGLGKSRLDGDGKPYPTANGIHGTAVAVDFEACIADGVCMDVCPVFVFEWFLNPGQSGTGKEKIVEKGTPEWDKYRTDKSDPVREADCIFCMACETSCPTLSIKITQP